MGISGLLPLLKSIQVDKHLSECSGQTLAVDAYVWLHRGVHACATELATGKKTNRYVDYAMHRVRLLRHHHIQPYVVLDGGPLPAKKGTESERKQRRDENLAKGNALAAQGKHQQARDFYVKCIDVTPQMAFQLIKALRAESVPYIVAPYEADAQMAYLERIGLVDGIITEDSDLLVYGCRQVYYKLDVVSATMTSISKSDFGANTDLSLVGWSDVQFRAMAILSGCDYLASIPGIGLKTAWALMRKHKTVENVIRAVRLEGKKDVPRKYLQEFRLAEKVFLHQMVYDPVGETLVHLTDIPEGQGWDEDTRAYMGANMDPALAKKVAMGDADPVTLLPMEDINTAYTPRIPLKSAVLNTSHQVKGKGKGTPSKSASEGILQFFAPKPKASQNPKPLSASQPARNTITTGKGSGKRTLVEVMDQDIAAKKKKREASLSPKKPKAFKESRFFGVEAPNSTPKRPETVAMPVAGSSGLRAVDKENIPLSDDDLDFIMDDPDDPVTQEDGYISPSPSFSRMDTPDPDLSSPSRPSHTLKHNDNDFDADALSSPITTTLAPQRLSRSIEKLQWGCGEVPVQETPALPGERQEPNDGQGGPDLRDMFAEDPTSEIDCFEEEKTVDSAPPVTPDVEREVDVGLEFEDELEEDDMGVEAIAVRTEIVASGWWAKWGKGPRDQVRVPAIYLPHARGEDIDVTSAMHQRPALVRRETNITPTGVQRQRATRPQSSSIHRNKIRPKPRLSDRPSEVRKSLVFLQEVPKGGDAVARPLTSDSSGSDLADDIVLTAQSRLARFRCNVR